ncbi:glycosyltransferase family 4 protein [Nocardia wallacei]|uniref:glycosyltransferase family 4 protein n=1 Tax=Nocardia wallacei TaxID=480035 RepID=UPI0024545589|nr:glycosyltransferase family 4 protein [Nocardia wallacei]
MRIALVHRDLHQMTRGGICTVYRALATVLMRHGHQVTLVTQQTPHPVTIAGVEVATLPRTEDLDAHRAAVDDLLGQLHPDVVECSTWEAETLSYLERPRPRRAPVVVRGEFSAATLGAPDLARDERRLVHAADRVIAVSNYAADDLAARYGIDRPTVIHNGVDRDRFRPGPATRPVSGTRVALRRDGTLADPRPVGELLESGEHVAPFTADPRGRVQVVWVGKVTPMKGWDRLEQLAARLADIATITAVVGHSAALCPITPAAEHLTALHDLHDTDMPAVFRSADWLLSTSRWEGFGLAIAEAIACGTPALLPHTLGTAPELLAAGGGRTYCDADDLADILTHRPPPDVRLPDSFTWHTNVSATLALYEQLITET